MGEIRSDDAPTSLLAITEPTPTARIPTMRLIAQNGTLYGTTYHAKGAETVFSESPYDGLIAVNGELYGTTYQARQEQLRDGI
jgi:hypothetical protein